MSDSPTTTDATADVEAGALEQPDLGEADLPSLSPEEARAQQSRYDREIRAQFVRDVKARLDSPRDARLSVGSVFDALDEVAARG